MNDNILPDSRLNDLRGSVMADWTCPDGKTIRLELQPIFCLVCGKPKGYVPTFMSVASFMCQRCAEENQEYVSTCMFSDELFWRDVAFEMESRFGHVLSNQELNVLAEQGRLGTALELLNRESPYQP